MTVQCTDCLVCDDCLHSVLTALCVMTVQCTVCLVCDDCLHSG